MKTLRVRGKQTAPEVVTWEDEKFSRRAVGTYPAVFLCWTEEPCRRAMKADAQGGGSQGNKREEEVSKHHFSIVLNYIA